MDKTRKYIIINTLTLIGEVADSAKHRIGRKGKFIRLTKGMRFEFYSEDIDHCLHSSEVEKIEELENTIRVHTLNTIYIFKIIDDDVCNEV